MNTSAKSHAWLCAVAVAGLFLCMPVRAQVFNLHLVTDNQPDYTDFDSFVDSSTKAWQTPEEKAIAVWRWGRRSRHQLSCSREGAKYIMDPILNYNSYGALNCGIISGLNLCSWLKLGYQARYVQLGDHTVSQVSWDAGKTWHLFDSSMSFFCYNHEGQIASCQEIKEAHGCELSGGKVEPDESLPDCLAREIREELGVAIRVEETFGQYEHAYSHFSITLHAFCCSLMDGEPRPIQAAELAWVSITDLKRYPMGKVDRQIARNLQA